MINLELRDVNKLAKNKDIQIIIGILLSFAVIYIINFLQRSTMLQYDFNYRINNIIKGIICIMIIMCGVTEKKVFTQMI